MSTPVFLLHVGRSGSRVLGDLLGQHPDLYFAREIFLTVGPDSVDGAGNGDLSLHVRPLPVVERHLLMVHKKFSVLSVKYFHLEYTGTALADLAKTFPHARYVLLHRRNILRKIVSSQLAQARGLWHQRLDRPADAEAAARVSTGKVDVQGLLIERPARPLVEYLDWYARSAIEARRVLFGVTTPLRLDYEDDVQDNPLVAYDKVVEFLGLPHRPALATLARTTPRPLRDTIENFDEVEAALRGTAHEWMLEG